MQEEDRDGNARHWIFTWNNYPPNHKELLDKLLPSYYVYGYENAPTTGTPHLQGYMYLGAKKRWAYLKKRLPNIWLKMMHTTPEAASAYCKKDGNFVEVGDLPAPPHEKGNQAQKDYWGNLRQLAIDRRLKDVEGIGLIHADKLAKWADTYHPIKVSRLPFDAPLGLWLYGPPRIGKSTRIDLYMEEHGYRLYRKPIDKWWTNYQYEDYVVIDEWSPYHREFTSLLKTWVNHIVQRVEVKGGTMEIRPKFFIVTSNYSIEECFKNTRNLDDKRDLEAIGGRFKEVYVEDRLSVTNLDLTTLIPDYPPPSRADPREGVSPAPVITPDIETANPPKRRHLEPYTDDEYDELDC